MTDGSMDKYTGLHVSQPMVYPGILEGGGGGSSMDLPKFALIKGGDLSLGPEGGGLGPGSPPPPPCTTRAQQALSVYLLLYCWAGISVLIE